MLGVSIGMWWFLRPSPKETKFAGGYRLLAHVRTEEDANSGQKWDVNHGRAEVVDAQGRVRLRGYYEDGLATGVWTYYDPFGRRVAQGRCVEGRRVGSWTGWHQNGRRAFKVQFAKAIETSKNVVVPYSQEELERCLSRAKFGPEIVAMRDGQSWQWWPNGRRRSQGAYQMGLRHGDWTFWAVDGRRTAKGKYDSGVRQGRWLEWDRVLESQTEYVYIEGVRYAAAAKLADQLAQQVRSDDANERFHALLLARHLDEEGLPVLEVALRSEDEQLVHAARLAVIELGEIAKPLVPHLDAAPVPDDEAQFDVLMARFRADESRRQATLEEILDYAQSCPERLRAELVAKLVEMGDPLYGGLKRVLEGADAERRRMAFEVLATLTGDWGIYGKTPSPSNYRQQVALLVRRAQSDSDPLIAEAAVELERRMGAAFPAP